MQARGPTKQATAFGAATRRRATIAAAALLATFGSTAAARADFTTATPVDPADAIDTTDSTRALTPLHTSNLERLQAAPTLALGTIAGRVAAKARGDGEGGGGKRSKRDEEEDDDGIMVTGTRRLAERFYEVGAFTAWGGPLATGGVDGKIGLTGIRVLENHGYISKFTIAMLVAMGQSNQRYVGSSYSTDGRYVYRTDYYRGLTPAERAAQEQQIADAINGEYVMELSVYSNGLFGYSPGTVVGKGFEFYLGGEVALNHSTLPAILQIAFGGAYLHASDVPFNGGEGPKNSGNSDTPLTDAEYAAPHTHDLMYLNLGVMLKAYVPINEWVELYGQWDLNAMSIFGKQKEAREKGNIYTSPLRFGAMVNLTDRAYVRAHISMNGIVSAFGEQLELGVRF